MRTINFELSKRLNDLGLLDNIKTEYKISEDGKIINDLQNDTIKTLTLEEAIEFLPKHIYWHKLLFGFENLYFVGYYTFDIGERHQFKTKIYGETLLEAIEKMLEYLLDNNLIK